MIKGHQLAQTYYVRQRGRAGLGVYGAGRGGRRGRGRDELSVEGEAQVAGAGDDRNRWASGHSSDKFPMSGK